MDLLYNISHEMFNGLEEEALCPARSPDLTPLDSFLCDDLKNKIYPTKPTYLQELRQCMIDQCHQFAPGRGFITQNT